MKLRVTDTSGAFDEDTLTINAASGTPSPTINTPTAGTTWGVNQTINFTGSATDPEQGTLPVRARLAADHQPLHGARGPDTATSTSSRAYDDTASGSFVAPDHDYPSTLELQR